MFILKNKKIFFAIAIILLGLSIGAIITKGFNWGIDFTGGSVVEVEYTGTVPAQEQVQTIVHTTYPNASVQKIGTTGYLIRTVELSQLAKDSLVNSLQPTGELTEKRFNTIGPSIGQELRTKTLIAIILVSFAIILFVAFAFRSVSQPITSWKYAVIVLAVLFHDIIIPAGYFAWSGIQVDTLFIVGLLTILGVSVNDTIVVFDRIRENLQKFYHGKKSMTFAEVVGKSITETFTRSIMTSLTVLIALLALVVFGPESTKNLSITMLLGMFFGTYSSIFIAAPLLVVWNNYSQKQTVK
jgi:preprotein translocase subunit SecF